MRRRRREQVMRGWGAARAKVGAPEDLALGATPVDGVDGGGRAAGDGRGGAGACGFGIDLAGAVCGARVAHPSRRTSSELSGEAATSVAPTRRGPRGGRSERRRPPAGWRAAPDPQRDASQGAPVKRARPAAGPAPPPENVTIDGRQRA
jgi:hypothetical protein